MSEVREATREELLTEVQLLRTEIKQLTEQHHEELHEKKVLIRYRDGLIDGLKFALRCNGVSGGDVKS